MMELQVSRQQQLEPLSLGSIQQVAILQPRPAELVSGSNLVVLERIAERKRRALIEQDAHSSRRERAAGRMLEHGPSLLEGHPGKPLHELRHERPVLQVLE